MIIYGASGHGKVVADILDSNLVQIDAVVDDNPEVKEFLNRQVQHTFSEEMLEKETIFAIGDNKIRKRVAGDFKGKVASALVHSSAVVSKNCTVENGTVVMANACINAAAKVGRHAIINTGAVVEHDVELEDFVHVSPGAVITGNVFVGEGTQVGAGAVIIPGVKIGKWCVIGAGSVIIKDVPDFATVVGNPGKVLKVVEKENEQ